ncbi:MAG: phosphatase PAP2 family protein [Gemmatimonadota bacterium]|nr:MAG: phosphatase PAP2 family protein [Gemmatimonadota bacterium]
MARIRAADVRAGALRLLKLTGTWRPVDLYCAAYLLGSSILILLFPARVPGRGWLHLGNLLGIGSLGAARWLVEQRVGRAWQFVLAAFPLLVFIWMYKELASLIRIFHEGWFDAPLIEFEYQLFGVHLSLWSERLISPFVTEWMLFGYLVYIPLVAIVAAILFFKVGSAVLDRYLLGLALAYSISFVITMLIPVEGPQYTFAEMYTRDLDGWVFRFLARLLAEYAQNPTGAFPSPHAAAGTVMLLFLGKHQKTAFFIVLPLVVTFYLSTVYGRYHYISDTIAGILLAVFLVSAVPRLHRLGASLPGARPSALKYPGHEDSSR